MGFPRHFFATQPLSSAIETAKEIELAAELEQVGNWFRAGETYELFSRSSEKNFNAETRARLFARAATCYEIACQARTSALAYQEAALLLMQEKLHPGIAAELFNRAAVQFSACGQHFFASQCWRFCADQFAKLSNNIVNCSDPYGSLPISAFKSHLCGWCYEAAAEAAIRAPGNEPLAVSAYWEAGKSYASGIPNIQAFDAYRSALKAGIKYYGTLESSRTRLYLPLTNEERRAELEPIYVMEQALKRCNDHHQDTPGPTQQSSLQTHRQMAATFHEFWRAASEVGNPLEAGGFRSAEKERNRKIYVLEGRHTQAFLYLLWKVTAGYGQSLLRWAASCGIVLALFATFYFAFDLIGPVSSRFDYIYFSVVTFTTLGYGDIHPLGVMGKILASLEVASGFLMFGILLSFLGNLFQKT